MTKTINKGKKDKKKFKIQKPLEGRRLPKLFNPDRIVAKKGGKA